MSWPRVVWFTVSSEPGLLLWLQLQTILPHGELHMDTYIQHSTPTIQALQGLTWQAGAQHAAMSAMSGGHTHHCLQSQGYMPAVLSPKSGKCTNTTYTFSRTCPRWSDCCWSAAPA